MLIETAQVVRVRDSRAVVKTQRGDACAGCAAKGACHALGGGKEVEVEVLNHLRAAVGDRVEMALPELSLVKVSAVAYLIPLASLMAGAILGQLLAEPLGWSANVASFVLAMAGVILSWTIVSRFNKKISAKEEFIPRIVRILPPAVIKSQSDTSTAETCLG